MFVCVCVRAVPFLNEMVVLVNGNCILNVIP